MNNNVVQPVQKKTNGLCIAGLICAFLVPLVGLILSIVGLSQAKKRNEDGKGLAIAGIIISVIEIIISIVITVVMFSAFMYVVEDATHEREGIDNHVDLIPPDVKVTNRTISVGERIKPEDFVVECYDRNGCYYEFLDEDIISNYTAPGVYTLTIIVSDDYGNETFKVVTLTIEAESEKVIYSRHIEYEKEKGYELDETYELSYSDKTSYKILNRADHKIVYTYSNDNNYQSDKNEYSGEPGYKFDDKNKKITYTEGSKTIGNGYSTPEDIDYYLVSEGFKKS